MEGKRLCNVGKERFIPLKSGQEESAAFSSKSFVNAGKN